MDLEENPYIEMRRKRRGVERPYLKGTRVGVADIAALSEYHQQTPDEIGEAYPHLKLAQIHAALTFFHANKEDIREMVRDDDAWVEAQRIDQQSALHGSSDGPATVSP